jgi:hypothetical protein
LCFYNNQKIEKLDIKALGISRFMINNQVWVFAVPCKEAKHKGRYSYLIATEKIREIGS